MLRIFLPLSKPSGIIRITGDKARYLSAVLRCKEGDDLLISDGKGTLFRSTINRVTSREVLAEIIGSTRSDTESPLNIVLIQGLLKGEKMDLVIQKTTELGIKEIIPTITERSQVRETRKVDRWRKIAEEASRQCGRTSVPTIYELVNFNDIFSISSPYSKYFNKNETSMHFQYTKGNENYPSPTPLPQGEGARGRVEDEFSNNIKGLIFWEEGGIRLNEALDKLKGCPSLMIAIGPEGGFTDKEVATAVSNGFIAASLGRRILRAETAAISATGIVQFVLGDLS